jgi:ribonuclease J
MPIHGELRMLKRHTELAQQMGIEPENTIIAENGQVVELVGKKLMRGERIPGDYVFVTGESIGDIDHDVMKERSQLARNGILLIDISIDKKTGRLQHEPEIITRGFVSPEDAEKILPEVRKLVLRMVHNDGFDDEKDIINAVKSYLHQQTKRRPMVFVTLSKS